MAVSHNDVPPELVVFKRGNDGFYQVVARANSSADAAEAVITNGAWAAVLVTGTHQLFKLNADGSVADDVHLLYLPSSAAKFYADGSYVVVTFEGILTYEFANNEWALIRNDTFENITFPYPQSTSGVRLEENYIVSPNEALPDGFYYVQLFSRQADQSWSFVESVPINATYDTVFRSFFWIDSDTLVMSGVLETGSLPFGSVFVFKKSNGEWDLAQRFDALDLQLTGFSYMGIAAHQLDKDNILIGAALEGYVSSLDGHNGGLMLLLQRSASGEWAITSKIHPAQRTSGFASVGVTSNAYDVLSFDCPANETAYLFACTIYTLPLCFYHPVNVTCDNQQLESCSSFDLDLSGLYIVNNPECGLTTTHFGDLQINNDGIHVYFNITKGPQSVQCAVTLECPDPPIAPPVSTVNTPSAKTPGSSQVSSAAAISVGILFVLSLVVF